MLREKNVIQAAQNFQLTVTSLSVNVINSGEHFLTVCVKFKSLLKGTGTTDRQNTVEGDH